MKFSGIINHPGDWLTGDGPHNQIVVSSRVRLARNLRNKPFPGWAKKSERVETMEMIKAAVESLPENGEPLFTAVAGAFPFGKTGARRKASHQP